ncbi:tetratricopeptide repeat protein [Paenibacillus sp. GCM10012307]|uniref:Tetratricopeptide repeat protein n=1 Tax=Paenibacillus roseus TaxID=2798579 RepID=A0A934J8I7_9BACL|nr:tetratricopeptide repeat protein [Paenibacillus roseus]MBJ6363558.1 tetratricopeptide repeat protein [Paenibacillus roseus]
MNSKESLRKAYESILYGDFEQAVYWFEQAMEGEPDNPDYFYRCSITCFRSGKLHKALVYAQKAVELDHERAEYHYQLQMVEAKLLADKAVKLMEQLQPDYVAALAALNDAIAKDPLSGEALLLLGIANGKLGRYADAVRNLRQLLKLHPQHEEAERLCREYSGKNREGMAPAWKRIRKRNR